MFLILKFFQSQHSTFPSLYMPFSTLFFTQGWCQATNSSFSTLVLMWESSPTTSYGPRMASRPQCPSKTLWWVTNTTEHLEPSRHFTYTITLNLHNNLLGNYNYSHFAHDKNKALKRQATCWGSSCVFCYHLSASPRTATRAIQGASETDMSYWGWKWSVNNWKIAS